MSDLLLAYSWAKSSYKALRNLKNHDLQVVRSHWTSIRISQFYSFSYGFKKYMSHYEDENNFISDILAIFSCKKIKLILPPNNKTEIIDCHRHKFSEDLVATETSE